MWFLEGDEGDEEGNEEEEDEKEEKDEAEVILFMHEKEGKMMMLTDMISEPLYGCNRYKYI